MVSFACRANVSVVTLSLCVIVVGLKDTACGDTVSKRSPFRDYDETLALTLITAMLMTTEK